MKKNIVTLIIFVCIIFSQNAFGQNLKPWWNELSPAWKEIFKKELGIEKEPTIEQLNEIVQIERLNCSGNENIENLKPLSQLRILEELNCGACPNLISLEGLENHQKLRRINCAKCGKLESLLPLKNVTTLEEISCRETMIINLNPLGNLQKLHTLRCEATLIRRLDGIRNLKNLEYLDISDNFELYDLDAIEDIQSLKILKLNRTKVSDLMPISKLANLVELEFRSCNVSSLKALQGMPSLLRIDCSYNRDVKSLNPLMYSGNDYQKLKCYGTGIPTSQINEFKNKYPNCSVLTSQK